jgi:hypothetical protein
MMVILYPAYAMTPLFVALYVRMLRSGNVLKYASAATALLLLVSPLGVDLPYATPLAIVIASCILFFIITSDSWRHTFAITIRFLLVTGILSLLLQGWWFLLFVTSIQDVFGISDTYRTAIGSSNLETMLAYSRTTSFVNLFQMQGQLASYTNDVGGVPWSSYDPVYLKPPFIVLGFIVPLLSALGLLHKQEKWRTYWGLLWISVLPAMAGAHPPFGEMYTWLFKNFRYASAYRAFYNKFGLLLPFACSYLAGLGTMLVLSYVVNRFKHRRVHTVLAVLSALVLLVGSLSVWGYPFWTGEIIPQANRLRGGAKIRVPEYYSDADAWLQKQGRDFRVMILPLPRLYLAAYDWNYGFYGHDPSVWLFSTPTIGRFTTPGSYALPIRVAELINTNRPTNVACLLGLLNVRYVLLHGDTSWDYVQARGWWVTQPQTSEGLLRESLSKQAGLQFAATIGQLHFYENLYVLPHTYVAHRLVYLDGELDALEAHCDITSLPAFFLSELEPGMVPKVREIQQAVANLYDPPAIEVSMLSPAHYRVDVQNAKAPFILVFGESYHPNWSARISGQSVTLHFSVNGYANAWYIEQTGSFSVDLYFEKQRLVDIGFVLSGLGLLLTGATFGIGCARSKSHNDLLQE